MHGSDSDAMMGKTMSKMMMMTVMMGYTGGRGGEMAGRVPL